MDSGTVELVDQEVIAAGKFFGVRGDLVSEIHGLLVDLEILEHEGHSGVEEEQENRRAGDRSGALRPLS
jgi:hypothetical protein